jgi:regulator of RNase E activity RraA
LVDWRPPVGCEGVAVFPDDVIVADQDGAMVVPQSMVGDAIEAGQEMEALKEWILQRALNGAVPGLYPPNAETLADFRKRNAGTT